MIFGMNDNTFLSRLEWRFATKKFDPEKKVMPEILNKILHAVRMAPTSYGLQPFHVVAVSDPKLRSRLKRAAFLQGQIVDSSHLLVFCARTDIADRIDRYVDLASGGSLIKKVSLQPLKLVMSQSVGKKRGDEALEWSARQAYIALGFALAACAELGVDSCPLEGFSSKDFDRILGLPEHMRSVVLLAVGYRVTDPERPKVRFLEQDMVSGR